MKEEKPLPPSLSLGEKVWEFLANRGKEGALLTEIYSELPMSSQRQIRYKVKEFTLRDFVTTDYSCRCGRATVYIAVAWALKKSLQELKNLKNIDHKKKLPTKLFRKKP